MTVCVCVVCVCCRVCACCRVCVYCAGHGVMPDAVRAGGGDSVQAGPREEGHHPRDLVGEAAGDYTHTHTVHTQYTQYTPYTQDTHKAHTHTHKQNTQSTPKQPQHTNTQHRHKPTPTPEEDSGGREYRTEVDSDK